MQRTLLLSLAMKLIVLIAITFLVNSEFVSSNYFSDEEDEAEKSHPYGKPQSLMWIDKENHSIMVDYDTISNIFSNEELADRKIVSVSVIGALRKGKSFLLDYCLRYMYANVSGDNCDFELCMNLFCPISSTSQ